MKKTIFKILTTIIILALAGYSYFIEPNRLEVNRYTVEGSGLKDIKVVFAGDFHIKPYGQKRLERIAGLINEENPDIVLSTGDYVCGHTKHSTMPIENIAKTLGKIQSKYGFFTTLGNHDSWYGKEIITKNLEENGIKVLSNKNIQLNIEGQKLYIAGVEDYDTGKPDIDKALNEIENEPVLLLSHSPDMFGRYLGKTTLLLAGHTHGGQIRLPLIGPIFTASNHHDKYSKGWIEEKEGKIIEVDETKPIKLSKDSKTMFVTRGIGVSILPFRFNCIPEIVVIEFKN
ncbi:metallophosphoesterase [bacterium]|nr:metallophosphoesterase [bacterium]